MLHNLNTLTASLTIKQTVPLCIPSQVPTTGADSFTEKSLKTSCFCKAVDADNTHKILHDFGSIQKCTRLFDCRCGHTAMVTCGDECDRRVTNWLKTNRWRCQFARTYYTASTCGAPTYGHHRKPC
ncbi:Hypothetical predicted protein [Mytilus galloprovincialis]|uniref:Uncharacterized protein n=1 Tax=Mytilus galloprovincialis TaxID=29158 RepID=A0A8B6H6V7_MYTGA|nr:Hypothetical predicted protein [Mytilus galloprovincialis]